MEKKVLTTPIQPEDLADINVGDVIYLTGYLTTCRDVAHRRVIEEGRKLPVDVKNGAILHAGPIIRKRGEGKYEMVTVGPTTSMRMEKFEEAFIAETGVRLIIAVVTIRRSTASFRLAAPSSPQPVSRRSWTRTGSTLGCPKRSGRAR